MKYFHDVRRVSDLLTLTALALALVLMVPVASQAHSPILLIEDNSDGTLLVMAAFSDGSSAAGKPIMLKSQATGATLWEGTLDPNGELLCPKQAEPYTIFFNGGAGHTLEKAGQILQPGEPAPPQAVTGVQPQSDATTTATPKLAAESITPIPEDKYLPLSADFDDRIKALLPDEPLTFRQENGEIRATDIVQGYQYHHQSGLKEVLAKLEERKQAGKDVEMAINPVGLCLGVTSGYLAAEYALRELYGADIPAVDDFTISTKTKMGGLWDFWDVSFGKRLDRSAAEFGIAPKGFVFTAERRSNGHVLVFSYSQALSADITHIGEAKQTPEKFPEREFQKVKNAFLSTMLTRRSQGDFGYFEVIEKNYE